MTDVSDEANATSSVETVHASLCEKVPLIKIRDTAISAQLLPEFP
ncbi:MAG: hypothetical protein AAF671_02775 [Pseudomonadota bacterium]